VRGRWRAPQKGHPWVEKLETGNDMTPHMTSVIENNVRGAELIDHTLQELIVLLATDANFDLVLFSTACTQH
jgi:hypothetical protein